MATAAPYLLSSLLIILFFTGRGDSSSRGRGEFSKRGDFRGRGEFSNRGESRDRGDFRGRGNDTTSRGFSRGRGEFSTRGQTDFGGRGGFEKQETENLVNFLQRFLTDTVGIRNPTIQNLDSFDIQTFFISGF